MLKKTITYTDYNDVERTEDFYFNISKAELAEMETSIPGGFQSMLQQIITTKDVPKIMEIFKKIILMAYGEKSPDGKRFVKSKELSDAFAQTEAYSELFMELASDGDKTTAFINGVLPKMSDAEMAAAKAKANEMLPGVIQ